MRWRVSLAVLASLLFFSCGTGERSDRREEEKSTTRIAGASWLSAMTERGDCAWIEMFSTSKRPALAFLWESFGANRECLVDYFSLPGSKVVQAYLSNGTCIRKRNCSHREAQSIGDIVSRGVDAALFVLERCESCEVRLIPQLEDNWTDEVACEIAHKMRVFAPDNVSIWRNPVRATAHNFYRDCYDGVELHNVEEFPEPYRGRCAWSNDGFDLELGNTIWPLEFRISRGAVLELAAGALRGCDIFIWTADGNCLDDDSGRAAEPALRDCRADAATVGDLGRMIAELESYD